MTAEDILKIGLYIISSFGGSSVIILLCSGWLGKVWANRIMIKEKATHDEELAKLRADLEHKNESELSKLKIEFDIFREKYLKSHNDKIIIYRQVVDLIAELLSNVNIALISGNQLSVEVKLDFDNKRMKIYGYLAMLAPQNVMNAYDSLIDYLFSIVIDGQHYDWKQVRARSLKLVNEVRMDIGIDVSLIKYNGNR